MVFRLFDTPRRAAQRAMRRPHRPACRNVESCRNWVLESTSGSSPRVGAQLDELAKILPIDERSLSSRRFRPDRLACQSAG